MMAPPAAGPQGEGAERHPKVTREIAAEAAVWIARLHGANRTKQMEREFRAWQAGSPAHREAFERCTDAWQDIPRIDLSTAFQALNFERERFSQRAVGQRRTAFRHWMVTAAVVGAVIIGSALTFYGSAENTYATKVGEQRLVLLEDGSRMLLNTDTRLHVDMKPRQRSVEVSRGEAFFEVAKDASRPFVVRVAGSEVVAVGTAFSVRYAPGAQTANELAVTLIEGQVKVRSAQVRGDDGPAPPQPILMKAGERLLIARPSRQAASDVTERLERPDIERVMAWRRGEMVFDDTALSDAVAEMNRYNRTPIILLDGLASAGLRISGTYRTNDSGGLARAVAVLYGLSVREHAGYFELTKPR